MPNRLFWITFATMKRFFPGTLLLIFLVICVGASAQTVVKVMSYNTLNFPFGSMPNRQDTLKKVLNYTQPDLLLLQEVRTAQGLNLLLNQSCNELPGSYLAAPFFPNQSGFGGNNDLQQCLIYNTEVFGLEAAYTVQTNLRDLNVYKLFFAEDALATGGDTTFVYVFNTHFKAGNEDSDEDDRTDMAEIAVEELAQLPENSYILFGGDFNLQNSSEPAYQLLLGGGGGNGLSDPIDAPGNWGASSYPFKEHHTQATRTDQIFNDGVGGGLDDRFDFILVSNNLKTAGSPVRYRFGSYKALGNSGTCYNQNITDCAGFNDVPLDILRAMYYFSDHLPVVMELELDFALTAEASTLSPHRASVIAHGMNLRVNTPGSSELHLIDLNSRTILIERVQEAATINCAHLAPGYYLTRLIDPRSGIEIGRQKVGLWR